MVGIELYHENKDLRRMLSMIGNRNEVASFYFPVFTQEKDEDIEPTHIKNFSIIREKDRNLLAKLDFSSMRKFSRQIVGVSSKVKLSDGTYAHIPQLDIDFPNRRLSDFTFEMNGLLLNMYNKEEVDGYLVNSGPSGFHYYGAKVLTEEQWKNWIDTAYNMSAVDDNWAKYSKERGFSVLRATSSKLILNEPTVQYEVRNSNN